MKSNWPEEIQNTGTFLLKSKSGITATSAVIATALVLTVAIVRRLLQKAKFPENNKCTSSDWY